MKGEKDSDPLSNGVANQTTGTLAYHNPTILNLFGQYVVFLFVQTIKKEQPTMTVGCSFNL